MIIMTIRFRTTWIIVKYLKCSTYCSCWTYYSWSNYAWCFLLGLIPPSKKKGTYFYSTPREHLVHYKVGNYDTIFLNFFYQFLKWLSSIWNYRTSCSTNQQWGTCQKVLGRHENARRQQNTIHYIPPGNHVFFYFFSFSISWFQNLWLVLCWTYTRKPKNYNYIYIFFFL